MKCRGLFWIGWSGGETSANALRGRAFLAEDHVQRQRQRSSLAIHGTGELSRGCPRESGEREEVVGKAADGKKLVGQEGVGLYSEHEGKWEVLEWEG